jgi:hypothetical protein
MVCMEAEHCKTVGSAYVGSNPTPATTCENGPLAAETRPAGRFALVTPFITVRHRASMCCGVHGRIEADGVRAVRTVGAHRRLSTDGHGRAAPAGCPGLRCAAEPGLWVSVIALMACRSTATVPGTVCPCPGNAGGLMSFATPGRLGAVPRRAGHVARGGPTGACIPGRRYRLACGRARADFISPRTCWSYWQGCGFE